MSLINKKAGFKVSLDWLKTRPGRRSTNDWMLFMLIILIFMVSSAIYHLFVFINVDKNSSIDTVSITANNIGSIDREALKKAVEYLRSKKDIISEPANVNSDTVSTSSIISLPSTKQ